MSVIFCDKLNNKPYYIKEADLNIYSIEELAFFIYEYSVLISHNFINKKLINYIGEVLDKNELAEELNNKFNTKKVSIIDFLGIILNKSNFYERKDIDIFYKNLYKLSNMNEDDYNEFAGDMLIKLNKIELAIKKYEKIASDNYKAMYKLAYCYGKIQLYEESAKTLRELFLKIHDKNVLKDYYYCLYILKETDKIYEFREYLNENDTSDWEFNMIKTKISAKQSPNAKELDDIFLMGEKYIKENIGIRINKMKEKYRFIN